MNSNSFRYMRKQVIGKNYETTAAYINDPNVSEYYIAPVGSSMDCGTMQKNYSALQQQIQYWNGVLRSATSAEATNISKILQVQQGKLNDYASAITIKCQTTSNTGAGAQLPTDTTTTTDIPIENNTGIIEYVKANPLIAAAVVVGAILLIKQLKKGHARRRARKHAAKK